MKKKEEKSKNVGINIGSDNEAVAKEVIDIIKVCHECRCEQQTIITALQSYQRGSTVGNVTVHGCNISMKE